MTQRTAIVTASDSGIGKATAVALATDGFDVGVTWHSDEDGAQDTADQIRASGRRAEVRRLDLEDLPGAGDVVDELAGALGGPLRAFVSNAGGGGEGPCSTSGGRTGARWSASTWTAPSSACSGRPG